MAAKMKLPGYQVGELISESGVDSQYQGQTESGVSVRIKVPTLERLNAEQFAAYRRSYKLVKNMEPDVVVQHLDLIDHQHSPVLILENYHGQLLEAEIPENGFSLEPLVNISLALASKLSKLHALNILHNGVRPANLVLDIESQSVRFTSLEEATRIRRNANSVNSVTGIEEMLAYAPPERSGRIESPIDDRSDLYSLGITLFQLASGKLPFTDHDKAALIYAHIAQAPPQLKHIRPDIPEVFSLIVSRLLEKNMDDRYASAMGLVRDLEHCASEIKRTGTVRLFEIAKNDVSPYFRIPDKLYGRTIESERFINAFESCRQGKRTFVTVSGMSGVGKSAFVNNMQKYIITGDGVYISGKFDQYQLDQPYLALIQAARMMLRKELSKPEEKLQVIKASLQEAMGVQGKLLTDVVPELELIIGPQPELEEVPHLDAERRFNGVVARFISVFATEDNAFSYFY